MSITAAENGLDLTAGKKLFLRDNPGDAPRLTVGPRINIDYAGPWKDEHLRFYDADRIASLLP
jgi:3-methyladenine DNA glycosylase Mpg